MSKIKWTTELTKALVAAYELQPILYKTTSPHYRNKVLLTKALDAIKLDLETTFEITLPTDEIMKKINSVRTQFLEVHRTYKKSLQSVAAADECPPPTWWLYDHLLFLLPYCKKDKSTSNLNTSALQQTGTSDEVNTMKAVKQTIFFPGNHAECVYVMDENGVLSTVSPSGCTCSSTVIQTKETPKTSFGNKRKRGDDMCSIVTNAIESIANEQSDLPSEIQYFCNFIGHELKAMVKPLLKQVKWQIVGAIREASED